MNIMTWRFFTEQTRGLCNTDCPDFFKSSWTLPIITVFTLSIAAVCTEDYCSFVCREMEASLPHTEPLGQLEHQDVTDKLPMGKGRTFQKSVKKIILLPIIFCCDTHYQLLHINSKLDLYVCLHTLSYTHTQQLNWAAVHSLLLCKVFNKNQLMLHAT